MEDFVLIITNVCQGFAIIKEFVKENLKELVAVSIMNVMLVLLAIQISISHFQLNALYSKEMVKFVIQSMNARSLTSAGSHQKLMLKLD
jgi:hypothetical protein